MFHSRVKWLLAGIVICGSIPVLAQTNGSSNPFNGHENNPYSRYGIGELANGNNTVLRSMGNITSAYANPFIINTDNPASYSFLQRTTFEVGATARRRNIYSQAQDLSYTTGTASIAHVTIGVPVGKNGGMSFGFRPYSTVYYNMRDTLPLASPVGAAFRFYQGEGALHYAFIGGAYKYRGLSLGFNFGYLFGSFQNTTAIVPQEDSIPTNTAYASEFSNYNRIGGIYWKGGAMYERKLDSNYTFRIGGTLNIGQNVRERLNAFQIAGFNFGDSIIRDTAFYPGELFGNLKMPMSYSVGLMLTRNDKWSLGVDYAATQWSQFNSQPDTNFNSGVGSRSYKLSLGGAYTPDVNNIRNYFSRVTYRAGFYYGTDYLKLNDIVLPVYGATAGVSLPFKRSLSHLHLGLDVGRLGTIKNNLLQQTYVRFTIGISFNDKWFIPRKYE